MNLRRPDRHDRAALNQHLTALRTPLNTCIGVVATTAALTKAEATRFATVAHHGHGRRRFRPADTLFDGDTVFSLATGRITAMPDDEDAARARSATLSHQRFEAGARCFAIACTPCRCVALSHPDGPPAYRDPCSVRASSAPGLEELT